MRHRLTQIMDVAGRDVHDVLSAVGDVCHGDIRIELHRSGTTVNVVWPAAAAAECAAWLCDWLR